ncbi:MAG: right-handed parallel beta-helix repeat-containing protein [Tepidisphaerales bacterium]
MNNEKTDCTFWQTLVAGALVLTALAGSAAAKTIHVSPQKLAEVAADEQTRTIGDAVRNLAAGDRVIIHGGMYRETVVVAASGTAEKPIIIEPATAEHVVVTGADLITDWKREDEKDRMFSTPWPHKFIGWNRTNTHPGDDFHLLIGRCEQVFAEHYPLRQVLSRDKLSRGTFFADTDGKRLYVWTANNADLSKRDTRVEASVRDVIWNGKGAHIQVRGLRFRYAANMAQHGAVVVSGNNSVFEDCLFEYTNSTGLTVIGARDVVLRRCTMQHNGQMGFGAGGAHNLLITQCTVRGNNTKGWDRGWEAGGDKICLSRGVIVESSRFVENRGNGIWFDIGNEQPTVRNCLIADNENAGIFYEISFGLHAHDNVIIGNGFDADHGAWGASAGISLSSSPDCRI